MKKKNITRILSVSLVFPILLGLSGKGLQTTAYAISEAPLPSTVCAGSNYCVPSVTPIVNPSTASLSQAPSSPPVISINPVISQNPCLSGTNYQSGNELRKRPHHHKHTKQSNGMFSSLIQFLLKLIEMLISLISGQTPGNPIPSGTPTGPSGQPAVSTIPGTSETPTTSTIPVSSVLSVMPTVDPCAPTAAPTVIVQPSISNQPPSSTPSSVPVSGTAGTTAQVKITFYSAYDNSPSGSLAISNPVIHQQAGGVGSYQDPLTFASANGTGAYKIGQKIYVPLLQKYFIRENTCAAGCDSVTQVDLYMGNPSTDAAVRNCEFSLTPSGNSTIIIDPPSNLTYDPTLIWDQATGKCMTPHK